MSQQNSKTGHHSLTLHSETLKDKIRQKIKCNKHISFADFMQMTLYYPGLGYYSSGRHKFGAVGDFITAPEIGNLFAQTLAKQFKQIIRRLNAPIILELGAGTGAFCCDCLLELEAFDSLPDKYYILEVSADLRQKQQQRISDLPQKLRGLVCWIQQPPPEKFNGVIFANEVVDALAVEVFKFENHNYQQMRVTWKDGFVQKWQPFEAPLNAQVNNKNLQLSSGYISEFIPHLELWLQAITENLNQGVVLFIDYGYDRKVYYHPQRNQGTLICFHQHQANFDYFDKIGQQDITAFVDFTALAEAADTNSLSVDGYTTQAHFLMSLGIAEILGDSEKNYQQYYQRSTEMKKLTLPNEMGEKFKVMALSRNYDTTLKGFELSNQLHLL